MKHLFLKSLSTFIFLTSLIMTAVVNAKETKSYLRYAADQILYTTGSITNVRDMPSVSGKLNVKLRINSKVNVISNRTEWVYVSAYARELGWIHKSLVSQEPNKLEQVLADAENTTFTLKRRRQLMERAAALAPLNTDILKKLEKSYLDEGNTKKAGQLKIHRLDLTKPILPVPNPKEQVIFLYENAQLYPFAKVRNGKIVVPYRNEREADKLLLQYFSPGQKFQIKLDDGSYGFLQVTDGTKPGYTGIGECHDSPAAKVRFLGNANNSLPREGFATNFALTERKTSYLTLNEKEKKQLNKMAMKVYYKQNGKWASIPKGESLEFQELLSGDVDGDGITDFVSLHTFHEELKQTRVGFFTLLVTNKAKNGKFIIRYGLSNGGRGDAVIQGANLKSLVDLNNDGTKEITYSSSHYEWGQNNVIGVKGGKYFTYSFFSGGC